MVSAAVPSGVPVSMACAHCREPLSRAVRAECQRRRALSPGGAGTCGPAGFVRPTSRNSSERLRGHCRRCAVSTGTSGSVAARRRIDGQLTKPDGPVDAGGALLSESGLVAERGVARVLCPSGVIVMVSSPNATARSRSSAAPMTRWRSRWASDRLDSRIASSGWPGRAAAAACPSRSTLRSMKPGTPVRMNASRYRSPTMFIRRLRSGSAAVAAGCSVRPARLPAGGPRSRG